MLIVASIFVALLLIIFLVNRQPVAPAVEEQKQDITTSGIEQEKVIINVPGINNAVLITSDNEKLPLPYTIKGKEGDKFNFTLRADGYVDKKIELEISPRRNSYEYNLDKIKN